MSSDPDTDVTQGFLHWLAPRAKNLLKIGEELWICSYPFLAVVLLIVLARIPQVNEIDDFFNRAVFGRAHSASGDPVDIFRMFAFMVLAAIYCASSIAMSGLAALQLKPGEKSTIPYWLAGLTLLSCAGIVFGPIGANVLTLSAIVAFVAIPFLPREFSGRLKPLHFEDAKRFRTVTISLLVFGLAVFIATCISPVAFPRLVSSWPIVYTAVGFWTLAGSLVFIALPRHWGLPSFWLLPFAWALACSGFNDNHGINLPKDSNASERDAPLISFVDHVHDWTRRCQTNRGQKCIMTIVAAQGGGSRAAYWTEAVLDQLDQQTGGKFSDTVFAVSSVSGGTLGATAYYFTRNGSFERATAQSSCLENAVGSDFLAPIVSSLVFSNAIQAFLPFPVPALDRARPFERSIEVSLQPCVPDQQFLQTFRPSEYRGPILLLNSTNVESGKRFIVANVLSPWGKTYDAYFAFDQHMPYRIDSISTATVPML